MKKIYFGSGTPAALSSTGDRSNHAICQPLRPEPVSKEEVSGKGAAAEGEEEEKERGKENSREKKHKDKKRERKCSAVRRHQGLYRPTLAPLVQ